MFTDYDVIIIGSGCAGLAAGIYTSRAGLSTGILEKGGMGGEMMSRQLIENYPGFANGVMGPDLGSAMLAQASNAGAEVESGEVTGVQDKGSYKIVKTLNGSLTCKGVIIAGGSHPRLLQVPGEQELAHKGVFYCATCDGVLCAGKPVVVAGAGDSGITEALYLERLGCKVTIVELMPQPKAAKILLDRAAANPNLEISCGTKIEAIVGDEWVSAVDIQDVATGARSRLEAGGIFVRIGLIPNTQFLQDLLPLDPGGQIPVNATMETAVPGIFAAGDVRFHSPAQMATAVGDGVTAAMALGRYLASL
ncbi:FAD-dependent oxidoreductase [Desulfosporosinus sp. PR]|uniref:NAD(P)/FAD-dependent oxidoreductase n=1 Tax=Candidatus Desulfosporosinus nitrosoreducens TaxID=3401928 RepID=UPI0027F57AEA|nr:FAD-dependent oxidoreductase [Desulfosporosinus sp. PR]MDQ7096528.1 FAD-dependent oxidoreductase [Desulfosporosinus sp. PR]